MDEPQTYNDDFGAEQGALPLEGGLVVDLDVYEGPIDVLLTLARDQKVDLRQISILKLADQYIAFIEKVKERAERFRIEIAADYLVMAAWLAFLKSRLLLPAPPEAAAAEPSPAEMAAALSFQLRRLQAMQEAGTRMMARAQLGRDIFPRGDAEGLRVVNKPIWDVSLYELLKSYGEFRSRGKIGGTLEIPPSELYSMDMAIERLSQMLGRMPDWTTLSTFLPQGLRGIVGRSAVAAMFAAGLELVRSGRLQLRQDTVFGPIYVRRAPENNRIAELPVAIDRAALDRSDEPPRIA
jgi:segregation and condensation protein A